MILSIDAEALRQVLASVLVLAPLLVKRLLSLAPSCSLDLTTCSSSAAASCTLHRPMGQHSLQLHSAAGNLANSILTLGPFLRRLSNHLSPCLRSDLPFPLWNGSAFHQLPNTVFGAYQRCGRCAL